LKKMAFMFDKELVYSLMVQRNWCDESHPTYYVLLHETGFVSRGLPIRKEYLR